MFKDLVKNYVSPLLKQQGFKKKDLCWNRKVDGLTQVINLQLSRYSNSGDIIFTMNIGVFDPKVWNKCWSKEPPVFINEQECFPCIRIGQLLNNMYKETTDHWWTINDEADEKYLGKEIIDLINNKCLKFLDSMLSKHNIVDFYSSAQIVLMPIEKIYLAIIKNSLGDICSSNDLLSEVSIISKAWSDRVKQVRSRLLTS